MRALFVFFLPFFLLLWPSSGVALDLFKGQIVRLSPKNALVWVESNQALKLRGRRNRLLYVQNEHSQSIAILKVLSVFPGHLKTRVIDGRLDQIQLGYKVFNVYRWDHFLYDVALVYQKKGWTFVVSDTLVLPDPMYGMANNQDADIKPYPDNLPKFYPIPLKDIQALAFRFYESLEINAIEFKDGRVDDGRKTDVYWEHWRRFDFLDRLQAKTLKVKTKSGLRLTLGPKHLKKLTLKKRRKASLAQTILNPLIPFFETKKVGPKKYETWFRFMNYELGFQALEKKIAQEKDSVQRQRWVQALKEYSERNIDYIGIAGSFNDWNPNSMRMTKHRSGFFETYTVLNSGPHQYYFVIFLKTYQGLVKIPILDPYSKKTRPKRFLKPGQEESPGVHGWVSELTLPLLDVKPQKPKKSQTLPYDPNDLSAKEKAFEKKRPFQVLQSGPYFKVQFRFLNDLEKVRLLLKKVINQQFQAPKKNLKRLSKYKYLLAHYHQEKVQNVYLIGTFSAWERKRFAMKRVSKGRGWSIDLFVPAGKHRYQYLIETGLKKYPYLKMPLKKITLVPDASKPVQKKS